MTWCEKMYEVRPLSRPAAREYICRHHGRGTFPNGAAPVYGLFRGALLVGVCAFTPGSSEAQRAQLLGRAENYRVRELGRFHVLDGEPGNVESWFLRRCLKRLPQDRAQVRAVLTYADEDAGHLGTIYQASGAAYSGVVEPRYEPVDQEGRRRSTRRGATTITNRAQAEALGWQWSKGSRKHRYTFVVGGTWQKARTRNALLDYQLQGGLMYQEYPTALQPKQLSLWQFRLTWGLARCTHIMYNKAITLVRRIVHALSPWSTARPPRRTTTSPRYAAPGS